MFVSSPHLGWTYSHRHAAWLGLDPLTSIETIISKWRPHILRLGVYWDESEPHPNQYDFTQIQALLDRCEHHKQPVLLSLGMKAPRWPEYYFPGHVVADPRNVETQKQALQFLETAITTLAPYTCVTHWQVENEPLDPSGPANLTIPHTFLEKECALVRSLDSRPIVLNLWGNDVMSRGLWLQAEALADITGLDLYYRQHVATVAGKNFYRGPFVRQATLQKKIKKAAKPVWITELQAEPWEKDEAGYRADQPGSMSLEHLEKNLQRARALGAEVIILWGAEYWLWRAEIEQVSAVLEKLQAEG